VWKLRKREVALPDKLAGLLNNSKPFLKLAELTDTEKVHFFEETMTVIVGLLSLGRGKQVIYISMMAIDADQNKLAVMHAYPPEQLPEIEGEQLRVDESAAGCSYKLKVPIYIPSTRHLGGINALTYRSVGLIYNPDSSLDPGPSLMCIPVYKDSNVTGVMNISCNRRNAFTPLDFQIGRFAAVLLSAVL
jgi:hypothetical protein